jgi:hypothetical protein
MSDREGQARGGAVAPARPADSPTPVSGPGRNPPTPVAIDNGLPAASTYHANLNGLNAASNVAVTPHSEAVRSILQQAYANRLPPVGVCEPISASDTLDEAQRDAVARAVQAPDLFLIQGPSGTGKSKVAAEVIRQLVGDGGRVLFLSPVPAALDSMLPAIESTVSVLRRLGPGEAAERLPGDVARLTSLGRLAAARDRLLRDADAAVTVAQGRLERVEAAKTTIAELADLRDRRARHDVERNGLLAEHDAIAAEVEREADSGADPAPYFVQQLRSLTSAYKRRSAEFDAADSELRAARASAEGTIQQAEEECARLRPKADALEHSRWYTLTYWTAKTDSKFGDRKTEAEARLAMARIALGELAVREQKAVGDRRLADDEYSAERARFFEEECTRRRIDLSARIAELDRLLAADNSRDGELVGELRRLGGDPAGGRAPAESNLERARFEIEQSRARAADVRARLETLAQQAFEHVSVVAGPVASAAADTEVLAAAPFDLLIVDDAHRLAEADFIAPARLARRWLLIGEPAYVPTMRNRTPQPDLFARLTTALRHDIWVRDETRFVCRLYPVRGADRRRLECEPVADAPDIEMRLFSPPGEQPTLAEVAFPVATEPGLAREYLRRELGEVTCDPRSRTANWESVEGQISVRFGPPDPAATFANIGDGIREELAGIETRAIHFGADWTIDQAKAWVAENVGRRDSGRVAALTIPQRSCPGLARWLNKAFGVGFGVPPAADEIAHIEFLAVPDTDGRRGRGSHPRTGRVGGAGYEIDLADARQRAALPADCSDLPTAGFVNVPEAQAIVRHLENLAGRDVAVASPFPSQVTLLRRLASRSSRSSGVRLLDVTEMARHECELLIVSLTRSHVARAVSFGESPSILAALLGRARKKVLFVGDPGTLARRLQWEGPVDHLDAAEAARERNWVAALADCPRISPPRHR